MPTRPPAAIAKLRRSNTGLKGNRGRPRRRLERWDATKTCPNITPKAITYRFVQALATLDKFVLVPISCRRLEHPFETNGCRIMIIMARAVSIRRKEQHGEGPVEQAG